MALLFRGCCSRCGYESPEVSAGTFAIMVTNPEEDDLREKGESPPVVLHPFADFVLDEFGLSFRTAAWGGQLVEVQNRICPDCGTISERHRLTAGNVAIGCLGCSLLAVAGFIAGIIGSFATRNPFIGAGISIAFCVLTVTAIEFSANRYVRWRYRNRAMAVDTAESCRRCGSGRCVPVGSRGGGPFPCPQCGETAVQMQPILRR